MRSHFHGEKSPRRFSLIACERRGFRCASFIAAVLAIVAPFNAMATHVDAPEVPDVVAVPGGSKAFLIGHAVGTQNYICLPEGAGAKWVLFGPQATVFDGHGKQIMTHFLSPNPAENSTPRATWQRSGGVAPASECTVTGDVGKTKFVPYTADYVFYK